MPAPPVIWKSEVTPGTETILPDGCLDIIWTGDGLVIAGPDTVPNAFTSDISRSMVGARFAPGVGAGVIGHDAAALRNRRVAASDLWAPAQVRRWTEQLAAADDPAHTLSALIAGRAVEPAPGWMAPVLARVLDGDRVAHVADEVGVSVRTVHRIFLRHCGYGPKMLARILRMRAAMTLVCAGAAADLSAIAHRVGYADHAHMCREFGELAGAPPSEFRPAQRSGSTQ